MSKRSTIIIAEAGVNHNGDLSMALDLIDIAAEAGADFVKFQTFKAENLVNQEAEMAEYQIRNTNAISETQFSMLKKLEIKEEWYPILIKKCNDCGIKFLTTAFDIETLDFISSFNFPFYKIPSGEITNKPYLAHIGNLGKDVIVSTGMANLNEISDAISILIESGLEKKQITILHCNTEYPTPMEDVNLLAMCNMQKEFDISVGYSDHTLGIEVSIAAVALGASVIEKHFTINRNLPGPDHKASIEPDELKLLVKSIRNIEKAISGNGIKEPSKSEQKNISVARKSLHLSKALSAGQVIQFSDLIVLRPGDGISPMLIDQIVGREVISDLSKGIKLSFNHLK